MELSDIPQHVLDCHDFMHQWVPEWTILGNDGLAERVATCQRCGANRFETIDPETGTTLRRRYRYAGEYMLPLGRHWDRADYRKENVRRALAPAPRARKKKEVAHV